ncbi:MAG: hypothetical protein ACK5TR_04690 [Alphaproteobacteria bacterium]|nr:hypothetical protein [Alphaproteobacteria bacterium]
MNISLSKALFLLGTSLFCADMCVASKRFDMDGDQTRKRAREAPAQTPPGTGFNHDLSGAENSGPAVKKRRVDERFGPVEGEEPSPKSFTLFADLPPELKLFIFSKLEDQQTMLNLRLVDRQTKALSDEFPLSLDVADMGKLHELVQDNPEALKSAKWMVHGWACDVSQKLAQIPSRLVLKGAHFYTNDVSRLPDGDHLPHGTKITLTTQTEVEVVNDIPVALASKGLTDRVIVRSQEALWQDFLNSGLARGYDATGKFFKGKAVLGCFLAQEEGAARLKFLLDHYEKGKLSHLVTLLQAMAPKDRGHLVSFLTPEFMSMYVKDGVLVHADFSSFVKHMRGKKQVKKRDDMGAFFKKVSSQALKKKGVMLSPEAVDVLARIKNTEKRDFIAALLTPYTADAEMVSFLGRFKDPNLCRVMAAELSPDFFNTLAGEDFLGLAPQRKRLIYKIVRSSDFNFSRDVSKEGIEYFFQIMTPLYKTLYEERRDEVFPGSSYDFIKKFVLNLSQRLSWIKDLKVRDEMVSFLCKSQFMGGSYRAELFDLITLLARMRAPELREEIAQYLSPDLFHEMRSALGVQGHFVQDTVISSILSNFTDALVEIPSREDRAQLFGIMTPYLKRVCRASIESTVPYGSPNVYASSRANIFCRALGSILDKTTRAEVASYLSSSLFDACQRANIKIADSLVRMLGALADPVACLQVALFLESYPDLLVGIQTEEDLKSLLAFMIKS